VEIRAEQVSELLKRNRLVPPEVFIHDARVLAERGPLLPAEKLLGIPLRQRFEEPAIEEPADERTPDLELERPPTELDPQIDLVPRVEQPDQISGQPGLQCLGGRE
jgi:hypothetical protein